MLRRVFRWFVVFVEEGSVSIKQERDRKEPGFPQSTTFFEA
jgi:hypothetical protein